MPTAKRKAREKALATARDEWDRQFEISPPGHLGKNTGTNSRLGDALYYAGTAYAWVGTRYDDDTGQPYRSPIPDDLGANVERKEASEFKAQELRREYIDLWNVRGGAKGIAAAEGIGLSTVYAHMARLRGV